MAIIVKLKILNINAYMSTAILEGYGDLTVNDGSTDFLIVKPTPFVKNNTKVKRWWRKNYSEVTYEACAIIEISDFYIVVSCAQDVELKMIYNGTDTLTFDVGYDNPGDGNVERILVVPKTEFHNPVNYDDYYYDYSIRSLRKNSYGTGVVFDVRFANADLDLRFAQNKTLTDNVSGNNLVTFTRASSGTYVGSDGLIKTAATNEARFDHSATGESLGLLMEEARTNIINSNYTSSSPIGGSSLSEVTSITNPDGTTGTVKVTALANNSRHEIQKTSGPPATDHTHSVFVKKGNHRYVGLAQGGASNNIHMIFDFDTKTITDTGAVNNGTFKSAGFEEYANGWIRLYLVGITGGTVLRTFLAQNDQQDGLANWTATGNEFFYIWGAQKEAGTFPTSFISSTGSTTRAADVAEITGTNFSSFYNSTEGTIYSEAAFAGLADASYPRIYTFWDPSSTEKYHRLLITTATAPFLLQARTRNSGTQASFNSNAVTVGQVLKTAYAYKANDFDVSFSQGTSGATSDTSGTIPTGVNQVRIGARAEDGNYKMTGHIKRLAFFAPRLTNSELGQLTS